MKTIQFRLNLWTNDLPAFPGHTQEAGVLRVEKNETRGNDGFESTMQICHFPYIVPSALSVMFIVYWDVIESKHDSHFVFGCYSISYRLICIII